MNYQDIKASLLQADIPNAELEARILMEDVAGLSKTDFILQRDQNLPNDIGQKLKSILERRLSGEPLGRILGYRDFWKSRFYLSPDTLEPRPDSETIIEAVLVENQKPRRILDLGTGTGCLLLSLLQEYPDATGIGVDLSEGACQTALGNAVRLGLQDRVQFRQGSWLEPLKQGERFDVIVSNPPYIPSEEIRNLQIEVQNHDPILALDGGKDGLDPYKILCSNLKKVLEPNGFVVFEHGVGQHVDIARIVEESGATLIRVLPDLSGRPRVIKFRYGDN